MYLTDQNKNNGVGIGESRLRQSYFKFPGWVILSVWLILTASFLITPAYALTRLQAEQVEVAYEKALIRFHAGDFKAARIHLRDALKANPRHLPSRILKAEILIKKGDGAGAERDLDFALDRGADYDRLIVLFGQSYILRGQYKYLLGVIHNGNRDNNIEAEISYLRGQAYFGSRKLANARRSYKQALDRNPFLQKAKLGLARVAAVHKKYDLAMEYIDSVLASSDSEADAWILRAKILKQRGFNHKAMDAINAALDIDNNNVISHLTRAVLDIDRRRFDEAEKDVDFILEKRSGEPRAKYLKTVITAARGDFIATKINVMEITNSLRSLPKQIMDSNPTYYYLAGLTNFRFGNLEEARRSLRQYLKLEKNNIRAMRLLGALELKAGDPLAANVILSRAALIQPDNLTILTMLGLAYVEIGNINKANYYLESVTKLLPKSAKGLSDLARGKNAAGYFSDAIDNLLTSENHDLDPIDMKLLLVKAYQQSGQYGKAVDIAREMTVKEPENVYILNIYGVAMGLAGDQVEARRSYEKALSFDKNNITSLIHLARLNVTEGRSENAIEELRRQLEKMPDDYILMGELGNIYQMLKNVKNAMFWYKKAYSLNSKDFSSLRNLVDGYILNHDMGSAVEVTSQFIDRFPKHADAYSFLAQLYQKSGDSAEAIINFKLAVKYAIKRGHALLDLAKAQLNGNNRSAAAKTLQKAVAWNPDLSEAYIALIKMAIEEADRKRGFDLLNHLRRITEKTDPIADILTGDLHMMLNEYKKAENAYLAALEIGDNSAAIMGLYRAYRQSDHIKKAIVLLEDWHREYPADSEVALSLGNTYQQDSQTLKAEKLYEDMLGRNPDLPLVLSDAARVNFSLGNEDKALDYAHKANSLMPDNANILDTLAWIESRRGNPETALPLLRKALVLRFSDPEIKYHLALTLDKLNRRPEARKQLAESVASRADFPEKKAARRTLELWLQN